MAYLVSEEEVPEVVQPSVIRGRWLAHVFCLQWDGEPASGHRVGRPRENINMVCLCPYGGVRTNVYIVVRGYAGLVN